MKKNLTLLSLSIVLSVSVFAQSLPSSINMKDLDGGTFIMGSNNLNGSPTQQAAAPEHEVTVSPFAMSEAEITNAQYVEFLNAAFADGLIEIVVGTAGPDNGKSLVQGTTSSSFSGKHLYNLDGTRVMKDHDDGDGDSNPFTGVIEPENPINIAYIGFNTTSNQFYVKDPKNADDFHWIDLCDYYDYGSTPGSSGTVLNNDFDDWSGAGQNLSDELQGWTAANPAGATNLPTQADVADWPVTFIRWWGAKAFAEYYGLSLPTEAQWEFAAKGGQDFDYAVHNGTDVADANWNQTGLTVATHHVRSSISGTANPFGLYNLAGNAWEWIADNYVAPYSTATVTDPFIEEAGSTLRCWRGGSWNYHEATLQSAMRFSDEEDRGNDHFGFRIAGEYDANGVEENDLNELFNFFPNPAENFVRLVLPMNQTYHLEIFDLTGKLIRNELVSNETKVSLIDLQSGIYFLKINDSRKKLIIN
jgi:formylglycine-generating enzyme required for sulfatase activity